MHILTCLAFMALFYGICIFGVLCDGGYHRIKTLHRSFSFFGRVLLSTILIFILGFVFYWVKQDRFIYFWDFAIYWKQSIHRMEYIFSHSFWETVKSVRNTINTKNYNDFLPCVIALPLRLFGYTHARYVFINFAMFLVPTVLVQGLLAVKICEGRTKASPAKIYLLAVLGATLFQNNYVAGLRGYIDIGFLLPASVAMYLFLDYDFNRFSVSRNIAISFTLLTAWISRRYVVYFVIGYVVAMLIKAGCSLASGGKWKETILNFIFIGGISLTILLVFFRSFILDALLTNYGYKYSAYDAPLLTKIDRVLLSFGIVSFIILVFVGALCFIRKSNRVTFVCMCAAIVSTAWMFWRTQNMDQHHRLLLNLPIFICFLLLLTFLERDSENRLKKSLQNGLVMLCAGLQILNFAAVFVPAFPNSQTVHFFAEKYEPYRRNDIDQLWQLASTLNSLTSGTSDTVYVVASSSILNDSILRCLNAPYTETSVPNMVHNRDVDLRDGFPPEFLQAKYVVTTTPVQTHLSSGQSVITYLADCLHDSSNYLGRHFQKVYEVELDDQVTAEIYEKCSDFTEADLTSLREYYNNLYPNDADLFANRIN